MLIKLFKKKLVDKQVNKEINLQIAVKAINNLVKQNKIISILLVFKAYP